MKIIITSYKEEETTYKCIQSILGQASKKDIVVVAPDEPTLSAARKQGVKTIKDLGLGKPKALNLAFKKVKDDLLVLTDGDVYLKKDSLKHLVSPFSDKEVGAVTGRPVSTNSRKTMLGFWSHLLTYAGAHTERMKKQKRGEFMVCSGYLYAIRGGIVKEINENSLSDDAVISHIVWKKGHKIAYAPEARVFVKYPKTLRDWIKQKRRSFAGYHQVSEWFPKAPRMRTFKKEVCLGLFRSFSYARNLKELFFVFCLLFVRAYVWLLTLYDLKIRKRSLKQIWQRVETTK